MLSIQHLLFTTSINTIYIETLRMSLSDQNTKKLVHNPNNSHSKEKQQQQQQNQKYKLKRLQK